MKITITIKKGDVLNEVHKLTAYVGSHRADKDGKILYGGIASMESDNEMLELYWRNAKAQLCDLCKRFTPLDISNADSNQSADDNEQFVLSLEVSASWDTDTLNTVLNAIRTYMIYSIVVSWLTVVAPAEAQSYVVEANNAGALLLKLLHHVKRPI
jgi:hypothetical protein